MAQLGVSLGGDDAVAVQRVERIPEVGAEQIRLAPGVDQLEVLDDELDVGKAAGPAPEALARL